jgi:Cellulose binding domain
MKTAFKSLVAAAAFISISAAQAATVNVPAGSTYKGLTLSGTQAWSLSSSAMMVLNLLNAQVTPSGVGAVNVTRTVSGKIVAVNVSGSLASVSLDDATDRLQGSTMSGGVSITVPSDDGLVSNGGSLVLSDLRVDLLTKRVYGNVNGGNGVGAQNNVYLWDFQTASAISAITPSSETAVTVSGLMLTADATNLVSTALGLTDTSAPALRSVTDFGTVTVNVRAGAPILTPCVAHYRSTKVSANRFTSEVTVRNNTSNTLTGWSVGWNYNVSTLLTNVKNAKITSKALKAYTAQPLAANKSIAPASSTAFTFRGQTLSTQPVVSGLTATLGGVSCAVFQP